MTNNEIQEVAQALVTLALEAEVGEQIDSRELLAILGDVAPGDLLTLCGSLATLAAMGLKQISQICGDDDPRQVWQDAIKQLHNQEKG
jgi:hypothetical protein